MDNFVGLWMFTVAFAGFISGISCGVFLCVCYPKLIERESERAAGVDLKPCEHDGARSTTDTLCREAGQKDAR